MVFSCFKHNSFVHTRLFVSNERKREINDTPKQLNMKYNDPNALTFHPNPLYAIALRVI